MDGLSILLLALYALAIMRLTRLINADEITDPIRMWAANKYGPESTLYYFLTCPWCVSIWLALGTAWIPLLLVDLPLWLWVFLGLAVSHLTGLAASLDSTDVEIEVE